MQKVANERELNGYLSCVVAEILDGVRMNWGRSGVGIRVPRQPDTGRRDVRQSRLGRRSGKCGRFRSPVENDGRIGRRLNNQSRTPRCLASFADCFTRVQRSV